MFLSNLARNIVLERKIEVRFVCYLIFDSSFCQTYKPERYFIGILHYSPVSHYCKQKLNSFSLF